ncbi:hypothetical protein [Clostridium tagluense]|uniref:Uncharacterized protein n=1 Tax=Clostridium tagluense TaxID=360422 RepID=A0A401UQD0_9CLOT|nr:hypothetical protein [Clostridium tagluense]GCD11762.1 hypothetical protein Ctaglu_33850 [Clostridium tagluense]
MGDKFYTSTGHQNLFNEGIEIYIDVEVKTMGFIQLEDKEETK